MNPTLQNNVRNFQLMVCHQDQHQGTVLLSNDPNLAVFRHCRLATAATVDRSLALSRLLRCHSKTQPNCQRSTKACEQLPLSLLCQIDRGHAPWDHSSLRNMSPVHLTVGARCTTEKPKYSEGCLPCQRVETQKGEKFSRVATAPRTAASRPTIRVPLTEGIISVIQGPSSHPKTDFFADFNSPPSRPGKPPRTLPFFALLLLFLVVPSPSD